MMKRLPFAWIPKVTPPQKLTGDLSSECWKKAVLLPLNNLLDGASLEYKTETYLFCTDEALYFGVRCQEPHLDNLMLTGPVWNRDEFEIFLEPFQDTLDRHYHHLMIDAGGSYETARDHIYSKYGTLSLGKIPWKPKLEVAVGKGKEFWTCEIRCPYSELKLDPQAVAKQTLWRFNICRSRPSGIETENPDLIETKTPALDTKIKKTAMSWSWSPLGNLNFHTPERFGYILPETFATPDLSASIQKNCVQSAEDKAWLSPLSPELLAEIEFNMKALGSSTPEEAKRALETLKRLSEKTLSGAFLVEKKAHAQCNIFNTSKNLSGLQIAHDLEEWCFNLPIKEDLDPLPKKFANSIFQTKTSKHGCEFWYSIPPSPQNDPKLPLIVFLHGSHQWAREKIGNWKKFTDPHGIAVACLQGNFYDKLFEDRKTETVLSIIDDLKKLAPIDERNIMIAGHSRGGHEASYIGLLHPEIFRFINFCGANFNSKMTNGKWKDLDEKNRNAVTRSFQKNWIYVYFGEKDPFFEKLIRNFSTTAFQWVEELNPHHFKKEIIPDLGHSMRIDRSVEWFVKSMEESRKQEKE